MAEPHIISNAKMTIDRSTVRHQPRTEPPALVERILRPASGLAGLSCGVLALLVGVALLTHTGATQIGHDFTASGAAALLVLGCVALRGLAAVAPGEGLVLQLLGSYSGTVRTDGFHWLNPICTRRKVSTKIRNHETPLAKVNDADGIPIEIAAVVVWQLEDTARAVFAVEDFVQFVAVQAETAVRHISTSYPYDSQNTDGLSLRDHADEITERLCAELSARVAVAGVKVIEARITRLAYAPEIAQVMLQRQQAGAVVAARQQLVEGAVGMVEMALDRLATENIVELDDERKAAMVSNLLVVLCGERGAQPVVNTGSLYH